MVSKDITGNAYAVYDFISVSVQLLEEVATNVTLKLPAVVYVAEVFFWVEVVLLPKFQRYVVVAPDGSSDVFEKLKGVFTHILPDEANNA